MICSSFSLLWSLQEKNCEGFEKLENGTFLTREVKTVYLLPPQITLFKSPKYGLLLIIPKLPKNWKISTF